MNWLKHRYSKNYNFAFDAGALGFVYCCFHGDAQMAAIYALVQIIALAREDIIEHIELRGGL